MVLDFFKRRKRLSGASFVASREVPGIYTRKGEQGGRGEGKQMGRGDIEQGGRGGPNLPLTYPPHLTWDTLKRIRRERSAMRGQSGSVQCLVSGPGTEEQFQNEEEMYHSREKPYKNTEDHYQSSPNILEEDLLPQAHGVLKFTREL